MGGADDTNTSDLRNMGEKMDVGWLESILKRHRKNRSIDQVLSVEVEPAVGTGENYVSEMLRIKLKVVLGSGATAQRCLLMKRKPILNLEMDFINEYRVFKTEIQVYMEVLSRMEKLMEEHGDRSRRLWCDFISHKEEEYLILEDLRDSGYKTGDRRKMLDSEHVLLVARSLGRFHAMSAVLIAAGELDTGSLLAYSMSRNKDITNYFVTSAFSMLVNIIRTEWTKEWEDAANRLEKFSEIVNDKLEALWKEKTEELVVLNHGDCWTNNIMFSYDLGFDRPRGIRFVDFQESHYNSWAWDLVYLFHTSLRPEERTDAVLENYRSSLLECLRFYGQPTPPMSLERMSKELNRLRPMAIMVVVSILPILLARQEDVLDTGRLLDENDVEAQIAKKNMYRNPPYTAILRHDLHSWIQEGHI